MAALLTLTERERFLACLSLVHACASADVERQAQIYEAAVVICEGLPFVATDDGISLLVDVLTAGGAQREDLPTLGALLARLQGVGVRA